jgi:hypothetical protein
MKPKIMTSLLELEENKTYILTMEPYTSTPNILEVKVLIKLNNTIKLKINNEEKWWLTAKAIIIYDEVPIKYFRKEKLERIDNI